MSVLAVLESASLKPLHTNKGAATIQVDIRENTIMAFTYPKKDNLVSMPAAGLHMPP